MSNPQREAAQRMFEATPEELGRAAVVGAMRRALLDLGNTSGEVAISLYRKGIKGEAMSARHCPVAKYLTSLGFKDVRVAAETYIAEGSIFTPDPIIAFVGDFDRGCYPCLVGT